MDQKGLGNDAHAGHSGIQRGKGILKDDLQFLAQGPQLPAGKLGNIPPLIQNLAGSGLQKPDQQPAGGGLAAARFPRQAQGFPLQNGEGNVVDRLHHQGLSADGGGLGNKMLRQVFHANQRVFFSLLNDSPSFLQEAAHPATVRHFPQRRTLLQTDFPALIAAIAEHAALGQPGTDPARCRGWCKAPGHGAWKAGEWPSEAPGYRDERANGTYPPQDPSPQSCPHTSPQPASTCPPPPPDHG